MTDADDTVAGTVSTNRLTVHDPAHLPALIGEGGTLFGQRLRIDTGDGWVAIRPADGGLAIEQVDAPEGRE